MWLAVLLCSTLHCNQCLSVYEHPSSMMMKSRSEYNLRCMYVCIYGTGTNWAEPIESYPLQAFDKIMSINVKAMFSLTRKALPLLEATGSPQAPANVINIGSIDGTRVCIVDHFAYSSSKVRRKGEKDELLCAVGCEGMMT